LPGERPRRDDDVTGSAEQEAAHRRGALGAARGAARELANLARELGRIPRERRLARPRPPAEGLVLDLGGGHDPFPRSDAVVDKYVDDDFERGSPIPRDRPLIVADGQALPFRDGSVAYLIASHVLEHATDPAAFAAELSRVARAGFVQVPSALAERSFGWPFHPWLIEREGDILHFSPKHGAGDEWEGMHRVYAESPLLRMAVFARRSDFHHTIHWTGQLRVAVHGTSRAAETASYDTERTLAALRRSPAARLPESLSGALCCPVCSGALALSAGRLECGGCGRAYPVAGNAPVLLAEAAESVVAR
jgi:uncharacterized protein YbaR (Trm112 family)